MPKKKQQWGHPGAALSPEVVLATFFWSRRGGEAAWMGHTDIGEAVPERAGSDSPNYGVGMTGDTFIGM